MTAEGQEYASAVQQIDLLNQQAWDLMDGEDWKGMLARAGEAAALAKAAGYERGLAAAYRNAAFSHYMQTDFRIALSEARECLRLGERLKDSLTEADARMILGLVEWSLGNYECAMREGLSALRLYEEAKTEDRIARCCTLLGGLSVSLSDHNQALAYHLRAQVIFATLKDVSGEARSLSGIGTVLHAMGNHSEALRFHQQSLDLYRSVGNKAGEARALNELGTLLQDLGDDEKALELYREALRIRLESGNLGPQATTLMSLGRLHVKRKEFDQALEVLREALGISEQSGAKPKVYQAHQYLSEAYEGAGDLRLALYHHKEFHRVREEVFNEEASSRLRNVQISAETERAEKLQALLEELQETQSQLLHSEKMAGLGNLVGVLAHEINSPLGAIQSSSDLALRSIENLSAVELPPEAAHLKPVLQVLRESEEVTAGGVRRITRLMQSLKSFIRLDQASYQQADLNQAIEDTLTLIEPTLAGRVRVVKYYGELPQIYCHAAELNQVWMNLLRNASEAIDGEGTISIHTYLDKDWIYLDFKDTGRGIPAANMAKLFDPNFHVDGSRVRASISLFTSLNIVKKHGGEIRVESKPGQGSTFTVLLPRSLETPHPEHEQ